MAPQLRQWGSDSQRPRFAGFGGQHTLISQEPDVLYYGIEAAESKLVGNLLKGRGGALRPLPFLDEIENLLLLSRQSTHTVYRYSITRVLPVNPEDGGWVNCLKLRVWANSVGEIPGSIQRELPSNISG